jgi:hypothetical protein
MVRSFAVFVLAFAGLWVLAGAGWALVAGALLVFVLWRREPDWRAVALRGRSMVRLVAGRVRVAPRRMVSVTGMGGAVVLLPAGLGLALGAGAALVGAAAALAGVSLLSGWNA